MESGKTGTHSFEEHTMSGIRVEVVLWPEYAKWRFLLNRVTYLPDYILSQKAVILI